MTKDGKEWVARRLLIPLILTLPSGCDNVGWEGVEIGLEGPGDRESSADTLDETPSPLPDHPVLYIVEPEGSFASIVPVGEIVEGRLRPLPSGPDTLGGGAAFAATRMPAGTEFSLLAGGRRVGTFLAGSATLMDSSYCLPKMKVAGVTKIQAPPSEPRSFLALAVAHAAHLPAGRSPAPTSTFEQRRTSLNIARSVIAREGARPPPEGLVAARRDLRVLRPPNGNAPIIAATFTYEDRLEIGPAPGRAYALFFLAESLGAEYGPTFTWYRPAGAEGKGVARLLDHADWNQDGEEEILLEVFGGEAKWIVGLARTGGRWERAYEEPCDTARS